MRHWTVWGCAAALAAAVPSAARAHELSCGKSVNGEVFLEADTYPLTLSYDLTVTNIHPDSPSECLEATDEVGGLCGFEGFETPFTLALGASTSKGYEVVVGSYQECLRLAALDGVADEYIDNAFAVRWDSGTEVCSARVQCVRPVELPTSDHRMTGGGSVFGTGKNRVTHGFQLRCDATDPRQNLEINFQGHHFHLTSLDTAVCTDDPSIDEGHPVAGFDTFTGTGTGRFDGVDGATVSFTFTDAGEPGVNDVARIVIRDAGGSTVLDVSGQLRFGNHQAHP